MISEAAKPAQVNRNHRARLTSIATSAAVVLVALPVAALLLLIAATAALPWFGYHPDVITGGSMEPNISVGSLVVTEPAQPADLKVGDVITYRRANMTVDLTHRIVAIEQVDGHPAFTTQGDANNTPDLPAISFSGEVRRVVFDVPYAGYVLVFVHSPQGMAVLFLLPLIAIAMLYVLNMGQPKRAEEIQRG